MSDAPTPEDVYRAAAEAYATSVAADWGGLPQAYEIAGRSLDRHLRAAVDAAYTAGHVDGSVAERSRLTRIIRRHANSAELPLCNALARIVDEMESVDA